MPFAASGLFRAQVINAELLTRGEDVKKVYEITINTEVKQKAKIEVF